MPDLLAYQPSHSAAYYAPTKQIALVRFVLGLIAAAVAVVAGSIAYAYIQPRVDSLYGRVGGTVVAAVAVGLLGLIPVRFGRVRIAAVAAVAGTMLALLALYAMWLAWVHHVLLRAGVVVTYRMLIVHPIPLLRIISKISHVGTWQYNGDVVRGPGLVICWLVEAIMIGAAGVLIPIFGLFSDDPTCRECGARCERVRSLPRFAADRQREFVAAVQNRQYDLLASHDAPPHEDAPELSITLMSCPTCQTTHVLTINRIAWVVDAQGRGRVKTTPLIKQLLIPLQEAKQITEICSQIKARREAAKEKAEESASDAPIDSGTHPPVVSVDAPDATIIPGKPVASSGEEQAPEHESNARHPL